MSLVGAVQFKDKTAKFLKFKIQDSFRDPQQIVGLFYLNIKLFRKTPAKQYSSLKKLAEAMVAWSFILMNAPSPSGRRQNAAGAF
jgi:hypothetical protein